MNIHVFCQAYLKGANDTKTVHGRDVQCNTEESPFKLMLTWNASLGMLINIIR